MTLAFLGPIGLPELIILGLLGLLIFGKRLPEVGKSLGKGIVEFKKGLSGVEDDLSKTNAAPPPKQVENKQPDAELEAARQQLRDAQDRLRAAENKAH